MQAADTWRISSTRFLVLYVGLCVVWVGALSLWWAYLRRNKSRGRRPEPDVYERRCSPEGASWR